MIRLFQTHRVRFQTELEGMWDFEPLGEEGLPTGYRYSMPVPGCWEEHPAFLRYRGRAAYRKTFRLDAPRNVRLEFKGVSHTADVYLDGRRIAHHYNAFTPFSAVAPGLGQGGHELAVVVDNSFSEASALHIPNDYYTYGGIIRPVAMEYVSDVFIERVEFVPALSEGKWSADIRVVVRNISGAPVRLTVRGRLGDQPLDFGDAQIGETLTLEKTFAFGDVRPWSGESPNLYMLEARLYTGGGEPADDLIERVGFRQVATAGRSLRVNGRDVFLKGFCRHEDFGLVGCAIPFQLMVKDVELLLESGANSVRTSHYPNDERFLDLCDERGIYLWEENHARGLTIEMMKNPNFERQCEDCNREMVQAHINHPSIVIWGLLNECASEHPDGRKMYERQIFQLRSLDRSRPISFASCKLFEDICLDLPDIVSINVYSRWYRGKAPKEDLGELLAWIETTGGAGKPVIISEFGAEGLYGCRGPARVSWSEEGESDVLDEALSAYLAQPEVVGTYIWQFCDNRVTNEGVWPLRRGGSVNNKGVVDLFRRPKLAFYTVQKHYTRKKD